MPKYRHQLPHQSDRLFLSDGGIETSLVFHEGLDLPCFAAFPLLTDPARRAQLARCYEHYIDAARAQRRGIVLETPTWRANPDWARQLGYDAAALAAANRDAVAFLLELRERHETADTPIVISGNLGPRGDGYRADARMDVEAARGYHAEQLAVFAGTEVDLVAAFTMTYSDEAAGIALAARDQGLPLVLSFTLETDGLLPSGETLDAAIAHVDALSADYPAYYMINCAHPDHFMPMLAAGGDWRARIRGVRANASRRSHAELDAATELDDGDPQELGALYRAMRPLLPTLAVVGGCCGTDHRHVDCIGRALAA
jgi:homocysteine S-methyltransferase